MWFRNLSLLSLPADHAIDHADLELALSAHALRQPGPLEFETRGFEPVLTGGPWLHTSGAAGLFRLDTATRLLPASVLQAAVADRIKDHELNTGRKPGKRLRNEFREAALGELLPRAFVRIGSTAAYLDGHTLVVDSASARAAEAFATALRDALGTFPARPLACEASPTLLMSEWLIAGELPEGFEFGDAVELKDPSDQSTVVRGVHHDLTTDEIREHARCGKQVTKLGLIFDGRIGFVLDAKLVLRRVRFLDVVADQLDAQDGASPADLMAAEFALQVLELRRLFARLDQVLRFLP